jgi:hypothetical protein
MFMAFVICWVFLTADIFVLTSLNVAIDLNPYRTIYLRLLVNLSADDAR